MNFAKRLLMVFGSVALAGLIGVLFTPKLAHAVATLVQVTGPVNVENPFATASTGQFLQVPLVIQDAQAAAIESFEAKTNICFQLPVACPGGTTLTVPTLSSQGLVVIRLVIEYVSGGCTSGVHRPADVFLSTSTAKHYFNPMFTAQVGGFDQEVFNQQTRIYVDPGTNFSFGVEVDSGSDIVGNPSFVGCTVGVSGHLFVRTF